VRARLNGVIRAWGKRQAGIRIVCERRSNQPPSLSARRHMTGLVFEMEHNPWDPGALQDAPAIPPQSRADRQIGLGSHPRVTPFVGASLRMATSATNGSPSRPSTGVPMEIVWPHIGTVEQATNAVAACRLSATPVGHRAYEPAGPARLTGLRSACRYWGLSQKDYYAKADVWPLDPNGEIVVMLMIEDTLGIKNLRGDAQERARHRRRFLIGGRAT